MSFKSVQGHIAKHLAATSGMSTQEAQKHAGAILASASRHASASAKRKNPKLKRVKG